MAKLYFRYSSMNAGKSLQLLSVAFNYKERSKNVLIFTSDKDNRYGKKVVKSRIGLKSDAIPISEDMNISDYISDNHTNEKIDCILVDEAQFLTKEQVIQLSDLVDFENIPVICYGLRTDFQLEAFLGSIYLLTFADEINEIKTVCHCGKKATTNCRVKNGVVVDKGEQISIGGNESYVPLCRKCFKEGKII